MIYTTIDNFYVTDEQLQDSPSRRDDISLAVESQLRIYGCEIIQEGGVLLKLPQAVMATGQVLLQRFYCKESMLKFNVKRVAWACCWLATKLEENPRRLRDLLSVFVRVDKRREGKPLVPLDFYSKEYAIRKQELIDVERHLLRTFGFVLHVDHPHKFVLNYLNIFLKADQTLKQEAWSLANDSLRTTLSVRFKADTVACGIIFLAARRLKVPLPESPPWWELFKVDKADMYSVAREVHALYSMPKVEYVSVYRGRQQSPGEGTKDSTPILSPIGQSTPGLSGQDSETEAAAQVNKDAATGGTDARTSGDRPNGDGQEASEAGGGEHAREDDERRHDDEERRRERHKRSRSSRGDRDDDRDRDRRKHRTGDDYRDERGSKRDGERRKERRDKPERDSRSRHWDTEREDRSRR